MKCCCYLAGLPSSLYLSLYLTCKYLFKHACQIQTEIEIEVDEDGKTTCS